MKRDSINKLIAEYEKAGWIATHYPRLKEISLNGFATIPEKEAIKRMKEALAK